MSEEQQENLEDSTAAVPLEIEHRCESLIERFFKNFYDNAVVYGLGITAFLVAVGFYLRTYDSAQVKITLFQISSLIVLAAWLVKVLDEGFPKISLEQKKLLLPALCLLIWSILSFAFSSYKVTTIYGLSKRIFELSTFAIILLTFDEQKRKILINFLIVALTICLLYGLVQFIDTRYFPGGPPDKGIDKFVWRGAFGPRVFSTFGNPNMYGGFLVLMTPVVICKFIHASTKMKLFYFSLFPLIALNFYGSYAWWMIATLSIALLSFALLIFWSRANVSLVNSVALCVCALLVFAVTMHKSYDHWFKSDRHNLRWRKATWLATVEMIQKKPVAGWGVGSFWIVYPEFRKPEIFILEGKHNTQTDHAENLPLQIWATEGIIGLSIFLWFLVVFFSKCFKRLKEENQADEQKTELMALSSSAIAFFLAGFYSNMPIMFVGPGFFVWIFLGLAANRCTPTFPFPKGVDANTLSHPHPRYASPSPLEGEGGGEGRKGNLQTGYLILLLKLLLSAAIFYVAVKLLKDFVWAQLWDGARNPNEIPHFYISWLLFLACAFLGTGTFLVLCWKSHRCQSLLSLALCLFFIPYFWKHFMADIHHNRSVFWSKQGIWRRSPEYDGRVAKFPREYQMMYNRVGGALEHYDAVIKNNPGFAMATYFKGNVYNDWGSQMAGKAQSALDKGNFTEAEEFKKKTEEFWNNAIQSYAELRKIAPNYVQSHHQTGTVYQKFGDFYQALSDLPHPIPRPDLVGTPLLQRGTEYWQKALEWYERYKKIDPVFDQNYYRQAQIYTQMGELDNAEKMYLEHLNMPERIDPALKERATKPEAWVYLGDFYRFMKKSPNRAIDAYKKALELNPGNEEFLKRMKEVESN